MEIARDKIKQLKEDFRRGHIDSYFKQIRAQLLADRLPQLERAKLNQQVIDTLQQQNIPQLYRLVYHDKKKQIQQTSKPAILSLTDQTLLQLYIFLINNMNRVDSLLMLNNIIDLHYQPIFSNKYNQGHNRLLVKNLYELCNKYVGIMEQGKQHKNMVNACMNCIKALLYNKKDRGSQEQEFNQVIRSEYVLGYLFAWLQKLLGNPVYLITLTLVEYDIQISATETVRQYLDHHPNIIIQLLLQGDPQNNYLKSCALPSLTLANSFIKNINDNKALIQIVQPVLATSKTVYALTQTAGQQFYRINTFIYLLKNIEEIFSKLEQTALPSSLFAEMQAQNYWIFCANLLRTETYRTREVVFRILLSAIRNAVIAEVKLQNYISQTAIGLFVQGLELQLNAIAVSALQIFTHLYRYSQSHVEQTRQLRKWIDMFEIEAGLQSLVYSKNKQISSSASGVLSMKRQLQSGSEMHD